MMISSRAGHISSNAFAVTIVPRALRRPLCAVPLDGNDLAVGLRDVALDDIALVLETASDEMNEIGARVAVRLLPASCRAPSTGEWERRQRPLPPERRPPPRSRPDLASGWREAVLRRRRVTAPATAIRIRPAPSDRERSSRALPHLQGDDGEDRRRRRVPRAPRQRDWSAMDEAAPAEFEALFAGSDTITVDPQALERRFTIPERNRALVREFRDAHDKDFVGRAASGAGRLRAAPDAFWTGGACPPSTGPPCLFWRMFRASVDWRIRGGSDDGCRLCRDGAKPRPVADGDMLGRRFRRSGIGAAGPVDRSRRAEGAR